MTMLRRVLKPIAMEQGSEALMRPSRMCKAMGKEIREKGDEG